MIDKKFRDIREKSFCSNYKLSAQLQRISRFFALNQSKDYNSLSAHRKMPPRFVARHYAFVIKSRTNRVKARFPVYAGMRRINPVVPSAMEKNCMLSQKKFRPRRCAPNYVYASNSMCPETGKHKIFMHHERNIISELRLNYFRTEERRDKCSRCTAIRWLISDRYIGIMRPRAKT